VDVFMGDNEGLFVAEIEVGSEDEEFERPDWLGEEVTGDHRYYNSALCRLPYKDWEK
jgi:CYTH domain-containing protein